MVNGNTTKYLYKDTGSKLTKKLEIDFVANLGSKRFYIQSAYKMPDTAKIKQEKSSLLAINESFKKNIIVKDVIKPFQGQIPSDKSEGLLVSII